MRFNVISNLNTARGLRKDYDILKAELECRGHVVYGIQFNAIQPQVADVNLFLETLVPEVFKYAQQQWIIPNPEWWFPRYNVALPSLTRVLCKTRDSLRLFKPLVGNRASFIGFMSEDRHRPEVPRECEFLHVAGNSSVKNTDAILTAWAAVDHPLVIVSNVPKWAHLARGMRNVKVLSNMPCEDLTVLMNRSQFHLCPSKYEGYGHYLHEGLSVGALVFTGDGPPMTEFDTPTELLIPTRVESMLRLATLRGVGPEHVLQKVNYALSLSAERVQELSIDARRVFEQQKVTFQQTFSELLESAS